MTHRYPEDVNDAAGTNVETNNARLVDDEGNRVLPAVRVPQDSDPCCAEVINAPAKQLRDRLALLESKVPLLDEAAAVNGGGLALLGSVVVGGQVVETLTPENFTGGEGISPKMAELVGPPNLDEPIVLTYEGVEYVADGVYFRREGEDTFAMIDDSKLAWLEINNSAYARPASDVLLAYTSATSVIDTDKIATTKVETKDISAQNVNISGPLVATEIRTDSVESSGAISASSIKSVTGEAIIVDSPMDFGNNLLTAANCIKGFAISYGTTIVRQSPNVMVQNGVVTCSGSTASVFIQTNTDGALSMGMTFNDAGSVTFNNSGFVLFF